MRTLPLLAALALALTACPSKPAPPPAASAAAVIPAAPATSAEGASTAPSAVASGAAPAPSPPGLTLLPPTPPSPVAIRDCDPLGAGGGDPDCLATLLLMTKKRSIAECKQIDALPGYSAAPTAFARSFHTAIEGCFQGAMLRELDRRLVPLKSVDAKLFHREMELQKTFKGAWQATCDEVQAHDPPAGDFRGEFRCTTFLLELRTRQAESVNAGGLQTTHAPAVDVARAKRFKAFATQLCALPGLWSGGPPELCEARILGEIEDTLSAASRF